MADAGVLPVPSAQERLASLRTSGAWRIDAARFAYLEAMARRLETQPAPVRQRLEQKLQTGLADFVQRIEQRQPVARKRPAPASPLAQLNASLRQRHAASPESAQRDELASARAFRASWDKARALQQVQEALARKPANAGPLNSHALVLRSLDLLGALSPDYLRRFVAHVETLQWLEQARAGAPRKGSRPAGRARKKT